MGFFSGTRPGQSVAHGGAAFELPILYFRDDAFLLFFTADMGRVRGLMPSDRLHPVALPGGRAMVGVVAFNYIDTSIGPYGEVGVIVPCAHASRPPLTLWPAIRESAYRGFGALVLHLPVTARLARDAGRGEWGYTKFAADMSFRIDPERMSCRVSEEGRHVLTLTVARRGFVLRDRKPLVTYSVKDGRLIRTEIPQWAGYRMALRPGGCGLDLGDHDVADSIRALGLGSRPVVSRCYVERAAILPAGVVVEENVRPLAGYVGSDREGSLEVSYAEEGPGGP